MFRFESFHTYGVIGTAVILGGIIVQIIKRTQMKNLKGEHINVNPKNRSITRYLVGETFPGPMFVFLGMGIFQLLSSYSERY